jgi:hypothetical protein
MNIPH